jgi:hypothetical protein
MKGITNDLTGHMVAGIKKSKILDPLASSAQKAGWIRNWGDKFYSGYRRVLSHPNLYIQNSIKEGIEEVTEEVLMDIIANSSTVIESAFSNLGILEKQNTYNWFETDPVQRYLMSAAGGLIGGAAFEGMNTLEGKLYGNSAAINNSVDKTISQKIGRIVRNGGAQELIKNLERKRGDTGLSRNLSLRVVENIKGELTYEQSNGKGDSQDDAVINAAIQYVKAIDSIITGEGFNMTDQDIMIKAMSQDQRLMLLTQTNIDLKILDDI